MPNSTHLFFKSFQFYETKSGTLNKPSHLAPPGKLAKLVKLFAVPLRLLFLFCLLGGSASGWAANPDSTAVLDSKAMRIGINTFAWRSQLQGSDSLNARSRLYYHLSQDFLYNTTQENGRFTREDYLADVLHTWQLKPYWYLEEHLFYQNNRASFAAVSSATARMHFRPAITAAWKNQYAVFAGLKRDARAQQADTGPEFGGLANVGWVSDDGEELAGFNAYFNQANLSPRTFQRLISDARYEKRFGTLASLALRAEYRKNRAEDYVSQNVQRIQSDTMAAFLTGNYSVSEKLWFRSYNQLLLPNRAFSYRPLSETSPLLRNSEYRQYELQTLQEMFFQLAKFRANLQAGYKERNREYANVRDNLKDILQSTSSWAVNLTYLFSETNSVSSQTQGELLRVDTPSEQNNEDRDEVYYGSRLLLTSRWNPTFRTTFGLLGTYREFVYIKAAQSAENFTERTLNYEPGFVWAPGKFSWEAQMQLQAIYQVRNFASEQQRNRSNRTFNQQHRFRYEATRKLLFQLDYYRRENRLGLLNWENFTESPLDTTTSHNVSGYARLAIPYRQGEFAVRGGYRFFEQRIRNKAGLSAPAQPVTLIHLHNITRQHGPEIALERNNGHGFRFQGSLWLQHLNTYKDYRQTELPFLGNTFTAAELAQTNRNWYLYFDVSLHWAFHLSRYKRP